MIMCKIPYYRHMYDVVYVAYTIISKLDVTSFHMYRPYGEDLRDRNKMCRMLLCLSRSKV